MYRQNRVNASAAQDGVGSGGGGNGSGESQMEAAIRTFMILMGFGPNVEHGIEQDRAYADVRAKMTNAANDLREGAANLYEFGTNLPLGQTVMDLNGAMLNNDPSGQNRSSGAMFASAIGWGTVDIAGGKLWGLTFNQLSKGRHLVYEGLDKAGVIRYVGITGRDATIRFGEHLSSGTARSFLQYRVIDGATGLTRTQPRIWEQTLINRYGLQKNGGILLNRANSIAPKYWWRYNLKFK